MTKLQYFRWIIFSSCLLLVVVPAVAKAKAVTSCADTVPGKNTAKCLSKCKDPYMVYHLGGDAGCKQAPQGGNVNTKCCGTCTTHDLQSEGAARCLETCSGSSYPEHDEGGDSHCPDGKKCCYSPVPATPQTPPAAPPATDEKPEESSLPHFSSLITTTPTTTIGNIIRRLLGFAGSLTIIMMTYAGILWMTAGGKEQSVTRAKKIITWTVIGLILIFTSYTIVNFILTAVVSSS